MLGDTRRLPDAVDALSPFWHLPGVPDESFDPGLVEVLVAGVLGVLGQWGYRRRDLASNWAGSSRLTGSGGGAP